MQGITRPPEGTPIEHTSIPFLMDMQNAGMQSSLKFMKARVDDLLKQVKMLDRQIALMKRMYELQKATQRHYARLVRHDYRNVPSSQIAHGQRG